MTYPAPPPITPSPDAYETAPAKPVPATPSNIKMTRTKAHAAGASAAGGSVLGLAIAAIVVKALGPEWADQEFAIGTIITALIAGGTAWIGTERAPRNQPRI
jgi:hypothetical protein